VITSLTRRYTKKGDLMATFVLEDLEFGIEVMIFPKTMAIYGDKIDEDKIVLVTGRVDARDDTRKLMAIDIAVPDLSIDGGGTPMRLSTPSRLMTKARADELKELLSRY